MLVDKKGRLFGIINIIDLFVLVVILFLFYRFGYARLFQHSTRLITEKERPIEVTAELAAVRQPTIDALHKGDKVWETKTNAFLGEIVNIEVKPADIVQVQPDGRILETTSTMRKDVYVTIRGPGRVSQNTILLGGTELRVGTNLAIKTPLYAGSSTVVKINTELSQ